MNAKQFQQIRKTKKLTRENLAQLLGCSASAVYKWEKGERTIPKWAAEKMLSNIEISLTLESLNALTEIAAQTGSSLNFILQQTIRQHIAAENATPYTTKKTKP